MTTSSNSSIAPFLSVTEVYPEDKSQRQIKHTNVYSNIANAVNVREISIYDLQTLITGQRFFNPNDVQNLRFSYRKVFQLGAVAAGATATIAHNINGLTTFTRLYGTLIDKAGFYLPLPYVDALNVTNQVSLYADITNIYVVNGATANDIVSGIIVAEYLLN
jgi:ribosomal protein S16